MGAIHKSCTDLVSKSKNLHTPLPASNPISSIILAIFLQHSPQEVQGKRLRVIRFFDSSMLASLYPLFHALFSSFKAL
ncbi:hypothetical protein D2C84_03500 [Helicobacter pylori]|nr:hypothetical protein D2C86_04170 [Helicobacter pylori]QEF25323.1 hypothetical protein D2C84_03500 [Helicobacter pylori]